MMVKEPKRPTQDWGPHGWDPNTPDTYGCGGPEMMRAIEERRTGNKNKEPDEAELRTWDISVHHGPELKLFDE